MKSRLLIALFLLSVIRTWPAEQSLGEAARREHERRKKNKEQGVAVQVIEDGEVRRSLLPGPSPRNGDSSGPGCWGGSFDYDGTATSYDGCSAGGCATLDHWED